MQQSPKDFDPSKLKIKIERPEPRDIAACINFNIQSQQPVIEQRTNMPSKLVQTTQEKFQTKQFWADFKLDKALWSNLTLLVLKVLEKQPRS